MRLLLVTHFFPAHGGGVEIAALHLARALAREARVHIEWMASDCDPVPSGGPPALQYMPVRASNVIERRTGLPYPLWSPGAVSRLAAAVRACDAVHLHDCLYMGNVLAFLFARRHGKPVIVTQHVGAIPYRSALFRGLLALMYRAVGRPILSRADRLFFVSPAVREYFARFCRFRGPAVHVPNGVDGAVFSFADAAARDALRRAAGADPARPACLFVGRFVERKGIDIVLELARRLPGVDFQLVGDGGLRPEAAGLANVKVRRRLTPPQVAALYQSADLLVLPSVGEGFPLVVQEAMACGTPALVGTQTAAGSPEVAPLLFCEELGSPGAAARWAERLAALLADREALDARRPLVAQAARLRWSWQSAAARYAAALRELCG